MSEAVRETGTSPAEKAERERKKLQSIYAPMLRVLSSVGGVCNLVISVDCSLNYSHHKYNTKHYNRAKEME